jgi:hypothetical protein
MRVFGCCYFRTKFEPGTFVLDFAGWIWAVVEVPVERYYGPAEKLNITLPRLLLAKIDDYARAHGETRSGFLAEAARNAMR